nr:hypothetical protein [uncultured Rhodoferax sp.]
MKTDQIDNIVDALFGGNDSSAAAVDHVFSALLLAYGPAFTRSLGDAPEKEIKTFWGYQLSDFTHSLEAKRAIVWALQNLPPKVPNAIEFKLLCRNAPSKQVLALPAVVTVNPEIAAKVLEGLKSHPVAKIDHKAWAHRILADVKAGMKRSPAVVQMAKNAIGEAA